MDEGSPVSIHIYDISMGMAKQFSPMFLGKQLEGIWHTGIVVYNKEYYWQETIQGRTPFGTPTKVISLGHTYVPKEIIQEFIAEVSPRYTFATYKLLSNNCNNFSQEFTQFLLGTDIPSDIINLPEEVLNTPFGAMIKPFIEQMENNFKQQKLSQGQPFPFPYPPQVQQSQPSPQPSSQTPKPQQLSQQSPQPQKQQIPQQSPQQPQAKSTETSGPAKVQSTSGESEKKRNRYIKRDNGPLLSDQLGNIDNIIAKFKTIMKQPNDALCDKIKQYLASPDSKDKSPPEGTYELFEEIIATAPVGSLFSCLFMFRLLILRKIPAQYFVEQRDTLLDILTRLVASDAPKTVHAMALGVASNLFAVDVGTKFMMSPEITDKFLERAIEDLRGSDNATRLTSAAILYNYTLHFGKEDERSVQCVTAFLEVIRNESKLLDEETASRILLAIGNLAIRSQMAATLIADLGFANASDALLKSIKSTKLEDMVKEIKEFCWC